MRRLDLHPLRKLRNPGRHLRSLHRWVETFSDLDEVDWNKYLKQRYVNWRIPVHAKLVGEKHTTPAIQSDVLQCLVDAATNLHAALPPEVSHLPVAALIEFPSLFNSEVILFTDPDYFRSFKPKPVVSKSTKYESFQVDVEPSRTNLVSEFGLTLPPGARTGGCFLRQIDFEDDDDIREYESWTVAFYNGD